tara:strand:- start:762 stop:1355 length:594 start_codon:yes stop_codon:yes gene_type:complete
MRQKTTRRSLQQRILATAACLFVVSLSGCGDLMTNFNIAGKTQAQVTSDAQFKELKTVRAALKAEQPKKTTGALPNALPVPVIAAATTVPTISSVGYSSISSQPGKTLSQRRLMAIRAARMDAMRMLTEQVHGLNVQGDTLMSENVVQSDRFRASVSGLIAGSRTVKIEPKGSDTYAVTLEIDRDTIRQLLRANRGW